MAAAQSASEELDQAEILGVLDAIAAAPKKSEPGGGDSLRRQPEGCVPGMARNNTAPTPEALPSTSKVRLAAPERVAWSQAQKDALAQEIDEVLARKSLKSTTAGVLIVDAESRDVLYSKNAKKLLKPASNLKLLSTAMAMDLLGPDYRFQTTIYADGSIDAKGVLDGDLIIVGVHDFTWSNHFFASSNSVPEAIAEALYDQGLRKVEGKVIAMGEFELGGDNFGSYDPDAHRNSALSSLKKALKAKGIKTSKGSTNASFEPPKGAKALYTWSSPPLSVACIPLNQKSHNEFADALLRHVAWLRQGKSSYQAAEKEAKQWLSDAGINAKGVALVDGSGLSHDNRLSAQILVELSLYMLSRPAGDAWLRSLAEAGISGTYRGRLKGEDTKGRTFVKSGTLRDTIGSSGVLVNRHDGRRYVFSIIFNAVGKKSGRGAADAIVSALAKDWLQLGERPAIPTLLSAAVEDTGRMLRWQPVSTAKGYFVWMSEDGLVWDRAQASYVEESEFSLDSDAAPYVRITALGERSESDPSDVYRCDPPLQGRARALLVDANDSWQSEPASENYLAWGHALLPRVADALEGYSIESCADEQLEALELSAYALIIWSAGEDASSEDVLSASQSSKLQSYLQAGGAVVLNASYLDAVIVQDAWLKSSLAVSESAGAQSFPRAQARGGKLTVSSNAAGLFVIERGTIFQAQDDASTCMYYAGTKESACVRASGQKLLAFGFPLESIRSLDDRKATLSLLLEKL
ncbi:MAG: D-alanyl-D-alanine carboxypeptidase/D-alanyl-D-alanine-endopeptidase [Myxococcota bacterium]|nr:D-alanyl-D-alanine carboxypeptidase/D-alanyl-D-alanine-endopeptidase [Myxococcota bacterium]